MILYDSTVGGVQHRLGTSGFLYRSNKLMYDQATQSLWSTLQGKPVLGPLLGKGIVLKRRSVVTTTWGAWRKRHPGTTVLDLATGYARDYREGAAYADYFSTDELMFDVKHRDQRLPNKAEVIGLVFDEDVGEPSMAISVDFFSTHPIFHGRLGEQDFVALTDSSGAVRVYGLPAAAGEAGAGTLRLTEWDGVATARDERRVTWTLREEFLENEEGQRLQRLASHRAFWFGWYGAHPETRLVVD